MDQVIRFGTGRQARRAAEHYADTLWARGTPARAFFKLQHGGWITKIYEPFPDTHVIEAAGGVLWRRGAGGVEVALVHRPKYDDWSLPKGKLAADEHSLAGACREVAEETSVRPIVGRRLPGRRYGTRRGPKVVAYWAMRADSGTFAPSSEVDQVAWLPLGEARAQLSYPDDAETLDALGETPEASLVLVVRHASAGDPDQWTGDDVLRPLDARGRAQATALRHLLPVFGPARVSSTRHVRCIATVAPLAADLGADVEVEPSFNEDEYAAHPDAGLRRIRELAADETTWVTCSQGTVIPDLVATLAQDDGIALAEVPAKKGSVWALFFSAGRLIAADYYPALN